MLRKSFAPSGQPNAGGSAATQMLAIGAKSDAPWNEGHWKDPKFNSLLSEALSEIDDARRKNYIWAMQELLYQQGATVVPVFRDWLDADSNKVGGHTPHTLYDVDNGQIVGKAWLKARGGARVSPARKGRAGG